MEDDLGIVYHIDNAQQFWSGESLKLSAILQTFKHHLYLFRAGGYCNPTQCTDSILARLYPPEVFVPVCKISWYVLKYVSPQLQTDLRHPTTEKYLQSPLQLEHACELILESELFAFHSERMCEIIMDDIQSVRRTYWILTCFDC